jgi:ribonuclease-3
MKSVEIQALERALGYAFKDVGLITQALTHRSHHHEQGDSEHNERLEFLGDAVLDLCVTQLVMKYSPTTDEGHLSKLRSQLVSETSLAKAARAIQIGQFVRLGKGEEQSGGRNRDSLLADSMEAILAAIYIDGGLEAAQKIVSNVLAIFLKDAEKWAATSWNLITRDHKSRLQEYCQSLGLGAPTYVCLNSLGPDHEKSFHMGLYIQGLLIERAEGPTKKIATQYAADKVLCVEQNGVPLIEFFRSKGLNPQPQKIKSPLKSKSIINGVNRNVTVERF